jgi:voltage-gated potassium channel Kch
MNTKPTTKQILQYRFEKTLSSGTIAIIGWLGLLSLVIILVAGIMISILGLRQNEGESLNFIEATWQSMMHALDAGTLGGDSSWGIRIVMFLVTIGGIFVLSTLIGVLTSGFGAMIDDLRKGRTQVLEKDYTLIMGWSSKIFEILLQLMIAKESEKNAKIVILAPKDKVEMEDEIRAKIPDTQNVEIVCRTGSPLDLTDIAVVNPDNARSIIVLAPEGEPHPDNHILKSVLAITNNPQRKAGKYHIVAEIEDEENLEAAQLVGGEEASYVLASDLLARVGAQTCRQSGLSAVYTELLDFQGCEIYFKEIAELAGKTFHQSLFLFEDSTVIGIKTKNGDIKINPTSDTLIGAGDQIICIAEDDSTIKMSNNVAPADMSVIVDGKIAAEQKIERTLIIGWNIKGAKIIRELESYVAAGSEVVVLTEKEGAEWDVERLQPSIVKQKVKIIHGLTTKKANLEALEPEKFDHIILLSYLNEAVQESDSKTLICLLHLRHFAEHAGKDFSIVSEMRDIRNRRLAEVSKTDDFIIGDNLISLMLSQLSENADLKYVFDTLFSANGCEIYLRPIEGYVKTGQTVNFSTLIESGIAKRETPIGYRIQKESNSFEKAYGVYINPKKTEGIQFSTEDMLIVIAED